LAIVHAVQKWCPYLIGRHCKVKTDHDSFSTSWSNDYLQKSKKNGLQKCWVMILKLSTKKGKHNVVVDALSRKEEETKGSLCVISIP
jgi:hypothetical protein